jgi:kynurenine 3-monooxygenase
VFVDCLDRCGDHWDVAFSTFFQARKANTDAIADMAMQNYREIQDHIADDRFRLRKQVEHELMRRFPRVYTSMHVLVMFTHVPYAFAKACGGLQVKLLDTICGGIAAMDQIHWPAVEALLANYTVDVQERAIALGIDPGSVSSAGRDR